MIYIKNKISGQVKFAANNKTEIKNQDKAVDSVQYASVNFKDMQDFTYNQLLVKRSNLSFRGTKNEDASLKLENLSKTDNKELVSNFNKAVKKMLCAVNKLDTSDISQAYNVDATKKFITDELSNSEVTKFTDLLAKHGNEMPNIRNPIENFDRYLAITAPDLNITPSQKEKLRNNFNLWINRTLLSNFTLEILDHVSNIQEFKPYKKEINQIKELIDKKISCYGLSTETKDIVIRAKKKLGIKLDLPDSLELAKDTYDSLDLYKKSGQPLISRIKFNDFDPFFGPGQGIAVYKRHKKFKLTNLNQRTIYYNPIVLQQTLEKGNSKEIYKTIRHELGHYWHNKKIGDARFDTNDREKMLCILSPEEIEPLKKFEDLSENINLENHKADYFYFVDLAKLRYIIKNKNKLGLDKSAIKIIEEAKPVVEKIEETRDLIKETFLGNPQAISGAFISPNETVAVAIEESNFREYSAEFKKYLEKFGMPEIKDRSYLSSDHPVIKITNQKRTKDNL